MATSRLRVSVVVILTCVFWGGMFWVFWEGFTVLDSAISHAPTKTQTIHAIYNIFFLSLLAMLAVSSGVILYGLLFDSEEVRFLLTTPTSSQRIVLHKFQEAIVFSCWGFVFIGQPPVSCLWRASTVALVLFCLVVAVPHLVRFLAGQLWGDFMHVARELSPKDPHARPGRCLRVCSWRDSVSYAGPYSPPILATS